MQKVDHYIRQAKAARELALAALSERERLQLEKIADEWEGLAKERLSFLEQRSRSPQGQ